MRYFMEVAYKGTGYAGFQVQQNSTTIQGEIEQALLVFFRQPISLTGSSRTDAGVHALQNFFHFDTELVIQPTVMYNLNAMLPPAIMIKSIWQVADDAHCRFLATSREYKYYITAVKNPFLTETAWFYPYQVSVDLLNAAAAVLFDYTDYTSFSKRNTQVFTKECTIQKSEWRYEGDVLVYNVKANRFLRGMVRGLVGTMLLVGRGKITVNDFRNILLAKDPTKANFATPPHGLFLVEVSYP